MSNLHFTTNAVISERNARHADFLLRQAEFNKRVAKRRLRMEQGIAAINKRYGHATR